VDVVPLLLEDLPEVVELEERRGRTIDGRELEHGRFDTRERLSAVVKVTPAHVRRTDIERRRLVEEICESDEPAMILANTASRNAPQQADRVGMSGIPEHRLGRAFLDQTPCV